MPRRFGSKTETILTVDQTWPKIEYHEDDSTQDGGSSSALCPDFQQISDRVGQYETYNPVNHVRYYPVAMVVPGVEWSSIPPASALQYGGTFKSGLKIDFSAYESSPFAYSTLPYHGMSNPDYSGMVAEVGSQVSGHMQSKLNVLVAFGEGLKTLEMFKHPFKTISDIKPSKLTLKDISKGAASAFLEYKYGWRQVAKDIYDICHLYVKVEKHINYLKENLGFERHVSSSSEDVNTLPLGNYWYQSYIANSVWEAFQWTRITRKSAFSLTYIIDERVREITRFQHYLNALGVTKLVDAVWDLVPFSFVVDWFINWNKLKRLTYESMINSQLIVRMGYSDKFQYYVKPKTWIHDYGPYPYIPPTHSEWLGNEQVAYSSYVRVPGFPPSTEDSGFFGSLSKTEINAGTALIIQKLLQ
jgi:hypothetical protein